MPARTTAAAAIGRSASPPTARPGSAWSCNGRTRPASHTTRTKILDIQGKSQRRPKGAAFFVSFPLGAPIGPWAMPLSKAPAPGKRSPDCLPGLNHQSSSQSSNRSRMSVNRPTRLILASLVAAALSACAGGGGGVQPLTLPAPTAPAVGSIPQPTAEESQAIAKIGRAHV